MQENNNNESTKVDDNIKDNTQDTIVIGKQEINEEVDNTKETIILDKIKKQVAYDKEKNNEYEDHNVSSQEINALFGEESKIPKEEINQKNNEFDTKKYIPKKELKDTKPSKKETIKSTGFSLVAFVAVILILAAYTFYISKGFDTKPWEVYNTYRQTDTFSIAKIYELKGVDFFRPQLFYDGAKEHIIKSEPQIYTVLSVMLSSKLNIKLTLALRYVSYAFFLLSSIYFYKLSRLFFDRKLSLASLGVYMMLPMSMCVSRAIMPEAMLLFFYMAAVYYGFLFIKNTENDYSYISAIFLAFAVLIKVPALFFVLCMVFLFFKKFGIKAIKKKELYLYILITTIPSILYYNYVSMICDTPLSKNISGLNIFSGFLKTALNRYTLTFHVNSIRESFGTYIFVLSVIGFITLISRKKENCLLSSFSIFTFIGVFFVASVYKQPEQYVFLLPVIALLIVTFIKGYRLNIEKLLILILIFSTLIYFSHNTVNEKFKDDPKIEAYTDIVNSKIDENAKVAVNTDNRAYISSLNRWGARMGLKYYPFVPNDDKLELKYWVDDGITNIILLKNRPDYAGFSEHIDIFANKIYSDSNMDIYKVKNIEDIVLK